GDDATTLGGSLAFATDAGPLSDVGDYAVTPGRLTSSDYDITFVSGTLHIGKADQTITWNDPAPITYGTPLGENQLNANVSMVGPALPGALTYTPVTGTVLDAGLGQTLSVNVAGTNDYNPAQATVHIDVAKPTLTVTVDDQSKVYGQANPTFTVHYS